MVDEISTVDTYPSLITTIPYGSTERGPDGRIQVASSAVVHQTRLPRGAVQTAYVDYPVESVATVEESEVIVVEQPAAAAEQAATPTMSEEEQEEEKHEEEQVVTESPGLLQGLFGSSSQ